MSLFYVTGTSGSGKSSVCERLAKLGFEAHDTDETVNDWYDRETGAVVVFKPESPEQTTQWVKTHDFLMSEQKVSELASEAKSQDIFICGHASNDIDLMRYFKEVFCLLIDEQEARNRLQSRKIIHGAIIRSSSICS